MVFEKKEIGTPNIAVLDIGSYKLKIATCNFRKESIDIVGYTEKRQEQDILNMGEIGDLKGICENLRIAFKKVDPFNKIKRIVVNSITPDIFLNSNKISIQRKDETKDITKEEVYGIIKEVETECIERSIKNIRIKTGYLKEDLKLLLSNISHIYIDGNQVKDLIGKTGKNISISIVNIFIPISQYESIEEISKILGKEIITILPEEYAITKIFEDDKDVVIINIGNSNTFISVKKGQDIIGASKINIGMNDLFKKIKDTSIIPTERIIRDIESNLWQKEKELFLETLKSCLIAGLNEILDGRICPYKFFLTGGGGKGQFIKEYIGKIDLLNENIKIVKNIEFVEPDFSLGENETSEIGTNNVNLLSMIYVTHKIFYDESSVVKEILKEVIDEFKIQ